MKVLASLVCLLLVVVLSVVDSAPASDAETDVEKRSQNDCLVHGYRFRHGEVFSIPGYSHCLRYLCQYGGWDVHQGACEVDGQCHNVGSTFSNRDCVTYTCEMKNNMYQARSVQTLCKDADGHCRREWETFPYVINGRRYNRCQCIIGHRSDGIGYTSTRYSCGHK
ncbi:hypothetical protein EGW08_017297 [Elysia chlorotica]|uniref:Sushi domain-containing protein n=1 Tax=Elysia chlorotica TaxID=188477 RepID=A0A433T053_ELYCH|nr:hypothetical protein EGW08_017297 [Elysia chlorotica]